MPLPRGEMLITCLLLLHWAGIAAARAHGLCKSSHTRLLHFRSLTTFVWKPFLQKQTLPCPFQHHSYLATSRHSVECVKMAQISPALDALALDERTEGEVHHRAPLYLCGDIPIEITRKIVAFLVDTAGPCLCCKRKCRRSDYHKSGLRHLFNLCLTCRMFRQPVQDLLQKHLRIRSVGVHNDGHTFVHETEDWSTDFEFPAAHVLAMTHLSSTLMLRTAKNVT